MLNLSISPRILHKLTPGSHSKGGDVVHYLAVLIQGAGVRYLDYLANSLHLPTQSLIGSINGGGVELASF